MTSFLTEPESLAGDADDAEEPKRLNQNEADAEHESMLMNDFLSSAIIDHYQHHHHHSHHSYHHSHSHSHHHCHNPSSLHSTCTTQADEPGSYGGGLVAPSSPPPPLFLDGSCPIPDLLSEMY
jgi:hypothetical protein